MLKIDIYRLNRSGHINFLSSRVIILNTYYLMKEPNIQNQRIDKSTVPIPQESSALLKILSDKCKQTEDDNIQLRRELDKRIITQCKQRNLLFQGQQPVQEFLKACSQNRRKRKDLMQSQIQNIKKEMKTNWENIVLREKDEKIKELNCLVDELKNKKINDSLEISNLNKELLRLKSSLVDANQFKAQTALMKQYEQILKRQSSKYSSTQQKNNRQMGQLRNKFDLSLAQYNSINNQLKRENERLRGQIEKSKAGRKEAILEAGISALKIFNHVSILGKQLNSQQYLNVEKEFFRCVKELQEEQAILNLNSNKTVENSFKKLMQFNAQEIITLREKKLQSQGNLSKKLQSLATETKDLKDKLAKKKEQFDSIQKQLTKEKQNYQNYQRQSQQQLNARELKIKNIQTELRTQTDLALKQNAKIQELEKRISQLTKTQQLRNTELTKIKTQSDSETQKLKNALKQITTLKQINSDTVNKLNDQTASKKQLQTAKEQLVKVSRQKDAIILSNKRKIQELGSAKIKAEDRVKELDMQVSKLKRSNDQLSDQKKRLFESQKILKDDLKKMTNKFETSSRQATKLSKDVQDLRQDLNESQGKLRWMSCYEMAFNVVNKNLIAELSYFLNKQKYSINIESVDESAKEVLQNFKNIFSQIKYFGDSEIIEREKISFLTKEIKAFTNSISFQTKLIYRYDPRNSINFHQFIDGVENLFVVIKLVNDSVVGGFSCCPIEKDRVLSKSYGMGRGIIFSLTHNRSFIMKKDPRTPVLTYDDYFFIFGNSELRLKSQEKKFFSNFGVSNSTFENGSFMRTDFLGVKDMANNELQLISFEFYQLKFKL